MLARFLTCDLDDRQSHLAQRRLGEQLHFRAKLCLGAILLILLEGVFADLQNDLAKGHETGQSLTAILEHGSADAAHQVDEVRHGVAYKGFAFRIIGSLISGASCLCTASTASFKCFMT